MLDNERAVMGDNNPPAYDPETLSEWDIKVTDFLKATQTWLKMEEIKTEEHAGQLTDQIDGLRGLYKKVDTARKDAKKPHDDAGKEVQAAFTPLLTKLKTAADKLKPKLADYATAKAKAEAAEKARLEEEARKKAEEAEAELQKAEAEGDISAKVDAEAKAKEAEQVAKQAAKKTETGVKSATGAGRTMSLRTIKDVEITNINPVFMRYRDHPDVHDTLQRLATAEVRAKGFEGEIPGVKIIEREVMA